MGFQGEKQSKARTAETGEDLQRLQYSSNRGMKVHVISEGELHLVLREAASHINKGNIQPCLPQP